jgi:hypothetical protein
MGDQLLHSPPDRAGSQEGDASIVGYYAVVSGVEVDGLRRTPFLRNLNFGE